MPVQNLSRLVFRGLLVLSLSPVFSGCVSATRNLESRREMPNDVQPVEQAATPAESAPTRPDIRVETAKLNPALRIPVELNAKVERWIQYFTKKDRERFQRYLDRGQLYRDVVENVLEENDLPAELYYLAMIESGYRTDAKSHAEAVGVWQFIAGTGSRYGLRIDSQVDERRDPIRATEAAAKYLRDLYNVFGSWHLAMAAYNAGEIRVLRAVMNGRTRNFWELVDAKALPQETAEYVPKFLAFVMIGKEPEKYGFRTGAGVDSYPNLKALEVPGSLDLKTIADKSGLDLETLKRVNPHLNAARTPSAHSGYELWFPVGSEDAVKRVLPELAALARTSRPVATHAPASVGPTVHVVKRGESLGSIARQYKISVGHLMRVNGMRSETVRTGMRLRTQAKEYVATNFVRYKVRRGENLAIIARKFKTSQEKIKASNHLKRGRVMVGQILQIESR